MKTAGRVWLMSRMIFFSFCRVLRRVNRITNMWLRSNVARNKCNFVIIFFDPINWYPFDIVKCAYIHLLWTEMFRHIRSESHYHAKEAITQSRKAGCYVIKLFKITQLHAYIKSKPWCCAAASMKAFACLSLWNLSGVTSVESAIPTLIPFISSVAKGTDESSADVDIN